jgi:hypothetical protein
MNANYFESGPEMNVRFEDGTYWGTCPGCPGWTVAADTWPEFMQLVGEWHAMPEAPHRSWTAITPFHGWVSPGVAE